MNVKFDVMDGYAIHETPPEHGITPVIITGRESKILENRALELNVTMLFQGVKDKPALLNHLNPGPYRAGFSAE